MSLVTPAAAQQLTDHAFDSSAFQPFQSSARAVADIVRETGQRRLALETKMRTPAAAQEPVAGPLALLEGANEKRGGGGGYDWQMLETWLPGEQGIQWCVSGFQTVRPVGGVKLYELTQAYAGPRSLQPWALAVTLKAQEQVPGARPTAAANPAMPHEFDYGTCVTPEFTRVGTYATAATFCGSDRECAQDPHISATSLNIKPMLVSFDACLDRSAGKVNIFLSALYFDLRPSPASIQLVLDGATLPGATVETSWPWLEVDYAMPLADYDSRFGARGDTALVAIASDKAFTPKADLYFSQSDWLSPCRE